MEIGSDHAGVAMIPMLSPWTVRAARPLPGAAGRRSIRCSLRTLGAAGCAVDRPPPELNKRAMASDPQLVARLEALLAGRPGIAPRTMFGGVCFMLNGNICVGVHNDLLIVRAGEQRASELLRRAHARPMDITGKPMRGWIMVGPAGLVRKADMARYVDAAVEFVATLPRK
jgi:hypothetical protein